MKAEDGITKLEGTIRSLKDQTIRKKDVRKMVGVLTIMNEEGDKIVIQSDPSVLDGFNPEEPVVIKISRPQKTLPESLKAKRSEGKK